MKLNQKLAMFIMGMVAVFTVAAQNPYAVTTYHYDNLRTGFNPYETQLTPANVTSKSFGLLYSVTLDDQVDAQPLFVPNVQITSGTPGIYNVVYIATENNTLYAIDATSGAVLLSKNFGKPVPAPLGCTNNGPNVGITGTPVIDLLTNTLYAITYTLENNVPVYRIHAIDIGSLTDKIPSVIVSASHPLAGQKTNAVFNAKYQRQRPALIELNGNVYAGFGSFCDLSANISRGWLLGWATGTLKPLASAQLNDRQAVKLLKSYFLSSIWMSGYGVSSDGSDLYFITGNSAPGSYDGVTNIQESVVKISPDLTSVLGIFTPSNVTTLDKSDIDFGSGGVLLLPSQIGVPPLAVAAGKDGRMFLLNSSNLGAHAYGNLPIGTYSIGACWCGQSYYSDANGVGYVVSSGGSTINLWQVQASPLALIKKASSQSIGGAQDPGFFTSISSNAGTNSIIWAVSRPGTDSLKTLSLYAFQPPSLGLLFSANAGTWPNTDANANIVPVVANGKVYVASNKTLSIFGLK